MAQAVPPGDGILHATTTSLQTAHSRQYFVDATTKTAYYLGREIIGSYTDRIPTTYLSGKHVSDTPPVGTRGYLMTRAQWEQFVRDGQMQGDFCIIDPLQVAPPPAAGPAPQFPPAPDILHATVTSLQNARSRQYCIDLLTMKAYYLGKEITGRYFDEVPTTDPTSTPPVGMRGLLMTRAQWNDYCARKGFSGNTCVIDSE